MTPEGRVKDEIKKILKEWGVMYWMPPMGTYGRVGVSDFIGCFHGRFLAIEAKQSADKHPTKMQQQFIDEVLEKGRGVALVIHDENLDLLTSTLRRMAREELM